MAALAVALAAGAGIGAWLGTRGGASSPQKPASTTIVVPATTGTITSTITAHGAIQPAQEADLNFAVSGRVTAVDVRIGQSVAAGQVLATVTSTALVATRASAQATLAAAQAKVGQDQATKAPASQLAADQAAVVSAQAALATATNSLAEAHLTSPIAGTVSTLSLTVGQTISGAGKPGTAAPPPPPPAPGGTTGGTPPPPADQVTVVSTNRFVVSTTVDDTQVGKLAVGDPVTISLSSSGGSGKATTSSALHGTVASVGLVPTTGTGIPAFPVTVGVTGTPSGVYAGSGVQLSIVVNKRTGVVEVPSAAISYRGGGAVVTVVRPGGGRMTRPVSVGATSGGKTQITRGLVAGQKVVERIRTIAGAGATGGGSGPGRSQSQTTGPPAVNHGG